MRCASAGEAPPVETPTTIGSRRTIAGRMKLQSSGSSATLQSVDPSAAARETAAFTSRSSVAAITSRRPSTSARSNVPPLDPHRQAPQLVVDVRRDDGHARLAVEEPVHLLGRDPPAADDETVASTQVEARHVVARVAHVARLVRRAPVESSRTAA